MCTTDGTIFWGVKRKQNLGYFEVIKVICLFFLSYHGILGLDTK